ncbi:uncharacterized protein PAC_11608 [Phialocephala subalpina]|uniref:Uncharacterized protein n=1 Tax=Phialocephala subalpina TaxID=576137 RepID=A0A1L7X9L3_9HELO|nr:uncharacterized protein PAC_11608 [Phialocephala subalpina]
MDQFSGNQRGPSPPAQSILVTELTPNSQSIVSLSHNGCFDPRVQSARDHGKQQGLRPIQPPLARAPKNDLGASIPEWERSPTSIFEFRSPTLQMPNIIQIRLTKTLLAAPPCPLLSVNMEAREIAVKRHNGYLGVCQSQIVIWGVTNGCPDSRKKLYYAWFDKDCSLEEECSPEENCLSEEEFSEKDFSMPGS